MGIYRFFFIQMVFRYIQAIRKSETRLWFAWIGPFLVAGGLALAIGRVEWLSPYSIVALFVAGSSIMRIQAGEVEDCPFKSLRNGALVLLGFTAFFYYFDRTWPGPAFAVAVATVLLLLHRWHQGVVAERADVIQRTAAI